MQKKLILLRCVDQTMSNEMAASQNPIQGSLFGENEHIDINDAEKLNTSKTSNGNLSHQQLEEDASLRPRIKQTAKNPNQIIDLDDLYYANAWLNEIERLGLLPIKAHVQI